MYIITHIKFYLVYIVKHINQSYAVYIVKPITSKLFDVTTSNQSNLMYKIETHRIKVICCPMLDQNYSIYITNRIYR